MTSTRLARFTSELASAKHARDFVRQALIQPPAVPSDIRDDVVLAVSELATNAIRHGVGDAIIVEIERSTDSVTLSVTSDLPANANVTDGAWQPSIPPGPGGKGLAIVRAASTAITMRAAGSRLSIACQFAI